MTEPAQIDHIRMVGTSVTVSAPGRTPLRFDLEQVVAQLVWSIDECSDHAVRGHAYLVRDDDREKVDLLRIEHGRVDHDEMMALHAAVEVRLQPDAAARKSERLDFWQDPRHPRFSFHMKAGDVERALTGRRLVHRARPSYADETTWPDLPEDFLRDPVGIFVAHYVGAVLWRSDWRADVLRPHFRGARSGDLIVVTARRPGSKFEGSGQDRTAAVFLSVDAGVRFTELPWQLVPEQRDTWFARSCWPPEDVFRVRVEAAPDGPNIEIEWDDPWIDFEPPGTEWVARWERASGCWTMRERPSRSD